MTSDPLRALLIADFNPGNLAGTLASEAAEPQLRTIVAPYGQVLPLLLDDAHPIWSERCDLAVVWTRPEAVIESFARVIEFQPTSPDALLAEVDQYADALLRISPRVGFALVPTWVVPDGERGLGLGDLRPGGVGHALLRMNQRLCERLAGSTNLYALDAGRWLQAGGPAAWSPKHWYLAKVPFRGDVWKAAAADIRAAVTALSGRARKLVVVDLDDTLWGGLVGEDGWKELRLGGHDALGEAYVAFQHGLRALRNRGVLLAIASKNTEAVATEAIREHPEMVLRPNDFAAWRINWNDKALNVAELLRELNLGPESAVFIDDSPAERERVREAIPELLVPDWPRDPMLYARALADLCCFDSGGLSAEDLRRTELYAVERERQALRDSIGSPEDWLRSLEVVVTCEPLADVILKRTVQLLNKTNQMNLSTRRLGETELLAWLDQGRRQLFTFRVADRFADAGLTGLLGLEHAGDSTTIVDFVLSCRVFGREVERVMAHIAWAEAQRAGASRLEAIYRLTERNAPCLAFWEASGFEHGTDAKRFTWQVARPYPEPELVSLVRG